MAKALICAGTLASQQGDFVMAQRRYEQSLAIRRSLTNKWALANSLNNLGAILCELDELDQVRVYLEEAIGIQRVIGDPAAVALTLHSLANLERARGA